MSRLRELTSDPAVLRADALVEEARQFLTHGRRIAARHALWAALAADANHTRAWLMLAALAAPRASLGYIHRALAVRPHDPVARAALAWADERLRQIPAAPPQHAETLPRQSAQQSAISRGKRFRLQLQASLRWSAASIRVFAENRLARWGTALIVLFALMALAQPILLGWVWPGGVYNPVTGYDTDVAPWPAGPSAMHLLGVDALGRDILSMLMAATRPAFVVALTAAAGTAVVGTAIGAFTAYERGPLDAVLYNFSSALYLLPAPVIMAIVGATLYSGINAVEFGLLYGMLAGGGGAAIVLRSHALSLMTKPYVDASRVAGAGGWHIITRHLVPHMLPLALVHMVLAGVGAVVADGFLAFFGLGHVRLNWGAMVYNSIDFLRVNNQIPWAAIVAPTAALSLFAAALYMIARGLEDVANPQLRRPGATAT